MCSGFGKPAKSRETQNKERSRSVWRERWAHNAQKSTNDTRRWRKWDRVEMEIIRWRQAQNFHSWLHSSEYAHDFEEEYGSSNGISARFRWLGKFKQFRLLNRRAIALKMSHAMGSNVSDWAQFWPGRFWRRVFGRDFERTAHSSINLPVQVWSSREQARTNNGEIVRTVGTQLGFYMRSTSHRRLGPYHPRPILPYTGNKWFDLSTEINEKI